MGGVKLSLNDASAVRAAYREIGNLGHWQVGGEHFKRRDSAAHGFGCKDTNYHRFEYRRRQFGPVPLFGTGGQLVEVFEDRALALPPLNTTLVRRFMERTRIFTALKGVRGRKPVDIEELERLLVGFSQLVLEQNWIREIDINPLLASSEGLLTLDARVVIYAAGTDSSEIPKPAIRPYPSKYAGQIALQDGTCSISVPFTPKTNRRLFGFTGRYRTRASTGDTFSS